MANRVVHADGDAFTSIGSNHAEAADLVMEHEDVPKDGKSLIKVLNSELCLAKGATATLTSLKFDKSLTLVDAQEIAEKLGSIGSASKWWWVDWMEWTGFKWGARYEVAARFMGCEPRRAELIYHYGRKYKTEDRIEGVPFAYYEMALDKNLSRQESMGAIRKAVELGKPCTFVKEIVVQLLAQKGIETKKKSSAKNVAPEDPHKALDEQAAIIRNKEAEVKAYLEQVEKLKTENKELQEQVEAQEYHNDKDCIIYLTESDYELGAKITEWHNSDNGTSLTVGEFTGVLFRDYAENYGVR